MNAVLQALFNINDIRELIQRLGNDKILHQLLETDAAPTSALLKKFRRQVFRMPECTLVGETAQQDAHEFLLLILNQLKWNPLKLFNRYEVEDTIHTSPTKDQTNHLSISINGMVGFQDALNNFFLLKI